jgi:hypothetical protein
MPAKGTTLAQTELRVNRIARLLANGATRSECVQYGASEWGLQPRMIDKYIQRARELLRADWEIDRKTFVAELLSQLASLQKEARKSNQPHVALGCINTAARIARVFE